jgi:hypothetical protein
MRENALWAVVNAQDGLVIRKTGMANADKTEQLLFRGNRIHFILSETC